MDLNACVVNNAITCVLSKTPSWYSLGVNIFISGLKYSLGFVIITRARDVHIGKAQGEVGAASPH